MLPVSGLTVLGADAKGIQATYNGAAAALPALIDSGTDAYAFNDPNIATCSTEPSSAITVRQCAGDGIHGEHRGWHVQPSNTVNFAIADPTLRGRRRRLHRSCRRRRLNHLHWGMPFFYGRQVYFGIDQRVSGAYTGFFLLLRVLACDRHGTMWGPRSGAGHTVAFRAPRDGFPRAGLYPFKSAF